MIKLIEGHLYIDKDNESTVVVEYVGEQKFKDLFFLCRTDTLSKYPLDNEWIIYNELENGTITHLGPKEDFPEYLL